MMNIEHFEELLRYLRDRGRVGGDEAPAFTRLAGGVSNRTVRVDCPDGRSFVLKQALPKLRVETDWFSDPRRIGQEALGLVWLERLAPPGAITPLLFQDPDQHLLAMQAVPHPHENWKTQLLDGRVEPPHVEQFATLLATIHRRSWVGKADGPPPRPAPIRWERAAEGRAGVGSWPEPVELADFFGDRSFFESLRLEPYYRFTASRHPAAAKFFADLIAETLAARLALTHGDYSPKNILVHQDRLVLLDHEVIHFGDPTFDLGFSLTHLLSKAHHLSARRRDFLEAARFYWETYRHAAGDLALTGGFESRAARHTLGCLLARVDGRSPLEYLRAAERDHQRAIVLALVAKPPQKIPDLVATFERRLGMKGDHEIRET